jgi:Family of unknown function (DUF5977)
MIYKTSCRAIILFACILLVQNICVAQDPASNSIQIAKAQFKEKQIISPAPEAAELGKYGNVPISLFTGTPSISIPLFDLKGKDLSLPVSLSYNASGYKPEEQSTWVGSGWSLNAGGVITRAAIGNPDIDGNYFGVANALTPPDRLDLLNYLDFIKDLGTGLKESQPDVFYYNFAGHSGKFLLRPDYSVIKKESDLTIITPCISNNCANSKFTIKDEQGITYVFEAIETTKMGATDEAGQSNYLQYNFVSAWYLTSIIPATGPETISFDYYSTGEQITNLYPRDNESFSSRYGPNICNSAISGSQYFSTPPEVKISKKYLKTVNLKRGGVTIQMIDVQSTAGLRLDSYYADDRILQNLKLYSINNGTNKLLKQYDLSQGYFTNIDHPIPYYRNKLRLDNVQEKGNDGSTNVKPAYVFSYATNGLALPPRYSSNIDHWGFFNNANNTSLVPTITFDAGPYVGNSTIGGGANREPSLVGSTYAVLNKIQYPTGGYTEFEYELNRAENDRPVGGIRVRQMIDNAFTNKPAIVKKYTYAKDNGTSSGNAGVPEYRNIGTYQNFSVPALGSSCSNISYTQNTLSVSANSIFGLGSAQGSHIGYSQVIEQQTDLATNETLGKTVNKYTVMLGEHDDDISNGDLIEQNIYDNGGKLLQATNNVYTYNTVSAIFGYISKPRPYQSSLNMYCQSSTYPYDYVNFNPYGFGPNNGGAGCIGVQRSAPTRNDLIEYNIVSQRKLLTTQTNKIYDQLSNNYITSSKTYTYGNPAHNAPTTIYETNNAGEQVVTTIKYAADYSINGSQACSNNFNNNIGYLNIFNLKNTPIEKLQYRQNADGSNKRLINGQITNYNLTNPTEVYVLETATALANVVPSTITSGCFTYDSRYKLAGSFGYDNNNNLVTQTKTDDIVKSYLWDYASLYPVAEVQNATSTQIAYTSFETTYKGSFSFNGAILASALTPPTGKKYYDLSSGNITATTDPSKIYIVSYWRNNNGSSPFSVAGSTNVKNGLAHNGWTCYQHEVVGNSSISISGIGFIDEVKLYPKNAFITTNTYEPMIGVTSECNSNNIITYYDYDIANRLVSVRDIDRNIVKNLAYNYGNFATALPASEKTMFYSAATEATFYKVCTTIGTISAPVIYKVPYGKYVALNQAAANQKADEDLATNGPIYANQNGSCLFYNVLYRKKFFKNNCPPEQGLGSPYLYTVRPGVYSSTISQADADAQAVAAANANGQAAANLYGGCSCGAEGQKIINGTCETGIRYYTSSTYIGYQWQCVYHYLFSDGTHSIDYVGNFGAPCDILQEP